jgi:putative glutamine amidotransferase
MKPENWHQNPFARLYPEKKLLRFNLHPIKIKNGSPFLSKMGLSKTTTPLVISSHHQAVDRLGKDMVVAATSLDGKVIEAITHKKFPNVLGVQFHPEFPIIWEPERSVNIEPDNSKAFNIRERMNQVSNSYRFHKKIWNWFVKNIELYHNRSR